MRPKAGESDKEFARRLFHNIDCRNLEFRRAKRKKELEVFGELSAPKPLEELSQYIEPLRLDKVIRMIPENYEAATPFRGLVEDHESCLHPEGGHESSHVEVQAVLERTAVVVGCYGTSLGMRWIEPHWRVLVIPQAFQVRLLNIHMAQAKDAGSRGRKIARAKKIAGAKVFPGSF